METRTADLNFTEMNHIFRELLSKHSNDTEITSEEHLKDAKANFESLANPNDEDFEYEMNLAATIYNAWRELCDLYSDESLEETCNWFFGATQEEASSTEDNNPWDVYVAPKGVF